MWATAIGAIDERAETRTVIPVRHFARIVVVFSVPTLRGLSFLSPAKTMLRRQSAHLHPDDP